MSDIVILQVQDPLGVLDNGRSVRGDKELDGLGKTVLAQEGTGLRTTELGLAVSTGHGQETTVLGIIGDWMTSTQNLYQHSRIHSQGTQRSSTHASR